MLLQARLEQTEATLQKLIGQMGVLTASLAGAGLVVGKSANEVTHEHLEEVDSDDEDEEEEDEENSNVEDEEEESEDEIGEDNEEDESEDESD